MPEYTIEGIVLRRWDSGEADRRVAVLTQDRGKVYLIAKGARKTGARLAPFTEPATHAVFAVGARRNAYITQVQPFRGFPALRTDYTRLMCAMAVLEVVDAVSPEDQAVPETFEETIRALEAVAAGGAAAALCWADLRLMAVTGHGPDFSKVSLRLSPEDGGAATLSSRDSFEVSKEVAIALSRLQGTPEPPANLRNAGEVARAILRFWETYAGKKLAARRALVEHLLEAER